MLQLLKFIMKTHSQRYCFVKKKYYFLLITLLVAVFCHSVSASDQNFDSDALCKHQVPNQAVEGNALSSPEFLRGQISDLKLLIQKKENYIEVIKSNIQKEQTKVVATLSVLFLDKTTHKIQKLWQKLDNTMVELTKMKSNLELLKMIAVEHDRHSQDIGRSLLAWQNSALTGRPWYTDDKVVFNKQINFLKEKLNLFNPGDHSRLRIVLPPSLGLVGLEVWKPFFIDFKLELVNEYSNTSEAGIRFTFDSFHGDEIDGLKLRLIELMGTDDVVKNYSHLTDQGVYTLEVPLYKNYVASTRILNRGLRPNQRAPKKMPFWFLSMDQNYRAQLFLQD